MNNTTARASTLADRSKARRRRKYVGDSDDPHFVPSSPLISRQTLTYEQEEELLRSCTLVLSGVPHTDDDEQDRMARYGRNQTSTRKHLYHATDKPAVTRPSLGSGGDLGIKSHKVSRRNMDTVTMSETSKRTTIDGTDAFTPLTILSDTLPRHLGTRHRTRQSNTGSSLSKTTSSAAVYAFLDKPYPNDQQREVKMSKSVACLHSARSTTNHPVSEPVTGAARNIKIAHLEFSKSLPSLPQFDDPVPAKKETSGFSRFLQSITKKSTLSTGFEGKKNGPFQRAESMPVVTTTKKHKFPFSSIFDRRRTQPST